MLLIAVLACSSVSITLMKLFFSDETFSIVMRVYVDLLFDEILRMKNCLLLRKIKKNNFKPFLSMRWRLISDAQTIDGFSFTRFPTIPSLNCVCVMERFCENPGAGVRLVGVPLIQ